MSEIRFCPDLQDVLLQGALIIWSRIDEYTATIVVRLPKGKLYRSENGYDYEYLQYDIHDIRDDNTMYHAVSMNGTKSSVIKRANQNHTERRLDAKRIIRNKQ